MTDTHILWVVFRRYWASIAITFSFLSLEIALIVLTPFMLGLAIDGLLAKSMVPAYWLVFMLIAGSVLGTGRRLYDTRCYGRIYADLAVGNVRQGWREGRPLSALSARSEQIREMVEFIEQDLAQSYQAVIKIFGALIMLALADLRLLGAAFVAAVAIGAVYVVSGERIYRLNRGLNDQHDKQVHLLESGNGQLVKSHFQSLMRWSVRLSDLEARNFALIDIVATLLVVFSLWVAASGQMSTPGEIFTILAYVLEFVEGGYLLPMAFQQFVRLKEIASRLSLSPEHLEKMS